MKKPLAVGIEDYKRIIDKNYSYVDKTLLIRDILDQAGMVNLFTRPRRFGKTLALSMLKTYFEAETDEKGNPVDNHGYFLGMKIMEAGERYTKHMGRYPVISLSLKSAKQPDFPTAVQVVEEQIAEEFKRHRYVLRSDDLLEDEKERFLALMSQRASRAQLATSLKFLSYCLKKYHEQRVIILLDEYDVPLETAYFQGFYEEMAAFIQSLFESALKTNDNLEFAVITGCLRISKESIFTGLNNLKSISLLSNHYAEYFGFTEQEVEEILLAYDIPDKMSTAKEWYDGYRFGDTEVYNPWSIMNYVDDAVGGAPFPKPYWSNTSSNGIVREFIETADAGARNEIERLLAGESICKPVHEDITYGEIQKSQDNLWNFLFFTGYLKMTGQEFRTDTIYLTLTIPNLEVRHIYKNTIRDWFQTRIRQSDFKTFYRSALKGDTEKMEAFLSGQLAGSISYHDSEEHFYHGYLVGIFSGMEGYELRSNQESGLGRPDLVLRPFRPEMPAMILEIKRAKKFTETETLCEKALAQIKDKKYSRELENEGYQNIIKYGICFCKKSCRIKKAQE